jgi:hypothetical protein
MLVALMVTSSFVDSFFTAVVGTSQRLQQSEAVNGSEAVLEAEGTDVY